MDREQFAYCFNEGYTWKWLEDKFGLSTYTLKNIAKDMGLGNKPKIYKPIIIPLPPKRHYFNKIQGLFY